MTFSRISTFMHKHEGEVEHQAINLIWAMLCVNAFMGMMKLAVMLGWIVP